MMGLSQFSPSLKISASQTRVPECRARKKIKRESESFILKFESQSLTRQVVYSE